jgi:hypothetical protein
VIASDLVDLIDLITDVWNEPSGTVVLKIGWAHGNFVLQAWEILSVTHGNSDDLTLGDGLNFVGVELSELDKFDLFRTGWLNKWITFACSSFHLCSGAILFSTLDVKINLIVKIVMKTFGVISFFSSIVCRSC